MEDIDRRLALTLGLAATSGVVAAFSTSAAAETYEADRGEEIAPGIRQIDLGSHVSPLPGYKMISMRDLVFQPKTNTYDPAAPNDMVCHLIEGILIVTQDGSAQYAQSYTGPWTSRRGIKTAYRNAFQDVAILRIIDLIAA
jgi:hypothetical protein